MKSSSDLLFYESSLTLISNYSEKLGDIVTNYKLLNNKVKTYGDRVIVNRDVYEVVLENGQSFCDWIFDWRGRPEEITAKKLLVEFIERMHKVAPEEYNSLESKAKSNNDKQYPLTGSKCMISLIKTNELPTFFQIVTEHDWIIFHRMLVLDSNSLDDIMDSVDACFPEIYFHNNVKTTIRSLNRKFSDIIYELVEHLAALNDNREIFININFLDCSRNFFKHTGIRCSPQSNRSGVVDLIVNVFNSDTKKTEEICCELHTKFSEFGTDMNGRDRMYFHPGKSGICDGKLLIFYIGSHI